MYRKCTHVHILARKYMDIHPYEHYHGVEWNKCISNHMHIFTDTHARTYIHPYIRYITYCDKYKEKKS